MREYQKDFILHQMLMSTYHSKRFKGGIYPLLQQTRDYIGKGVKWLKRANNDEKKRLIYFEITLDKLLQMVYNDIRR